MIDRDQEWLEEQQVNPTLPVLTGVTIDQKTKFLDTAIGTGTAMPAITPIDRIRAEFQSVPDRMAGEAEERAALTKRSLKYHVGFLDDMLRGILPHDLVLIGADTGVGKTQLALHIAAACASTGHRVTYFALEAEERELERRLKYRMVVKFAASRGIFGLTYVDWYLGNVPESLRPVEAEAEVALARMCKTLKTYYRRDAFGMADIRSRFMAVRDDSDLIVLDHLHYVDLDDDKGENAGFKDAIKTIRDVALQMGRPVICIAHLRKRGGRNADVVPGLDDFHGSSDVTKIATHAVMLCRAPSKPTDDPGLANTYMHVPKDRRAGATGYVALLRYDLASQRYRDEYQLGRVFGNEWEPIEHAKPHWAARHTEIVAPGQPMATRHAGSHR